MKFERLTNMSYEEAVRKNQSPIYIRLALFEDAIEKDQLIYVDNLKAKLKSVETELQSAKQNNADKLDTLRWLRQKIKV